MSHHWKGCKISPEPSQVGVAGPTKWTIVFQTRTGGRKITVVIPAQGVFDDPASPAKLKKKQVQRLAHAIRALLDAVLAKPD